MSSNSLLIDLGGTSTRLALSSDLDKLSIIETSTKPRELIEAIKTIVQGWDFKEIKVAAAGQWNQDQILVQSHNLANYIGYPIWQELSKELNSRFELHDDMFYSAIGEAVIGQKNQYQNLLYLNLGTGIGASFYDGSQVMSRNYSPCLRLDLKPHPKGIFYSKSITADNRSSIAALQDDLIYLALIISPEIICIGGGKAKQHWTSIVEPAIKASIEYLNQNLCYKIKIEQAKLEYPAMQGMSI